MFSCKNTSKSGSESGTDSQTELNTDKITKVQSGFIYSNGRKKVELILENGLEFLVVGEPTKASFKTENINNERFMIVGQGLTLNQADKNGFHLTITPVDKSIVQGKLEIRVTELVENGKNFKDRFFIPVKTTTY